MKIVFRSSVLLLWFLSFGVALVSLRFLILGISPTFGAVPVMADHIANRNLAFVLHVSASPIVLITGLFQFVPKLRIRRPALHRWTGRIYVLSAMIGGLAGLALAYGSMSDRPIAAAGFGMLAIVWIGITAHAIRLAITGQTAEHRRWMLRSYALAFSAVTLRLELPLFFIFTNMEYGAITAYIAWLCWVPNLIFAEWWLRRRGAGQSVKVTT